MTWAMKIFYGPAFLIEKLYELEDRKELFVQAP